MASNLSSGSDSNAGPSTYAIKCAADYIILLEKIGVLATASVTHAYFQLEGTRSSHFNRTMCTLIRKCTTEAEVVNSLSHAIIKNIRDSPMIRSILPVAKDAALAIKNVDDDSTAAFGSVKKTELKELELIMASRPADNSAEHHPKYVFFRIHAVNGMLVGFLDNRGLIPYPDDPANATDGNEPEENVTAQEPEVIPTRYSRMLDKSDLIPDCWA